MQIVLHRIWLKFLFEFGSSLIVLILPRMAPPSFPSAPWRLVPRMAPPPKSVCRLLLESCDGDGTPTSEMVRRPDDPKRRNEGTGEPKRKCTTWLFPSRPHIAKFQRSKPHISIFHRFTTEHVAQRKIGIMVPSHCIGTKLGRNNFQQFVGLLSTLIG